MKRVPLDIAKYSFGNRACDQWNKFPAAYYCNIPRHKYIQKQVTKISEENVEIQIS